MHDTTILFAALNVPHGTVIGNAASKAEIIRFLNAINVEVPAGKPVHVILDLYAAH